MTINAFPPSTAAMPGDMRDLAYFQLKEQLENLIYLESELLDQRRFRDWLDLLAEDFIYFMPMRRNVRFGEHAALENTQQGKDINWFDEDKWTITKRVEQIETGVHWAEEPLSRTCHMMTNVRLLETRSDAQGRNEAAVMSRFLVYQNRVEYETSFFVGTRKDILRRKDNAWKFLRREILLDQSVLLAKNLTTFF